MQPQFVIAYISTFVPLIPLTVAVVHRKNIQKNILPVIILIGLAFLMDVGALLLARQSVNTYPIGNIYLLVSFLLLSLSYYQVLNKPKWIAGAMIFFTLFFVVNFTFFEKPLKFNTYSNVMSSLILVAVAMRYLAKLLDDLPIIHVHLDPMLWVTFAILVYFGGTFFLFLVKNYLTYGDSGSHRNLWILHNTLNIIKNILFTVALWQSSRKENLSSSP
jgi:hypothetical protein